MATPVEHEKRKKKILEKALAVFKDEGFENATYQKIADKCGITRTILYLYFKNKKEIFNYSIKQLLLNVEENINSIRADKSLSSPDKIIRVLFTVFKLAEQNRQLLLVILDYLLHVSKKEISPQARVRRRTVKLQHVLLTIVIDGIKLGELKNTNIKKTKNYLYSFIESAIFQLAVLKCENLNGLKETAIFAVEQLKT
ncbi:TetR/AcrR family transcriptional regulator [Treponema sp. R80B11-R83G3]